MLNVQVKAHRIKLRAGVGPQKLFVLLKLAPTAAAPARPRIHVAVVVDTSGSMRHKIDLPDGSRRSKLDLAIAAVRRLVESPELRPEDRISLIQFDAEARLIAGGSGGQDRAALLAAVNDLGRHRGVTRMGAGLWKAIGEVETVAVDTHRILVLSDGQTLEPDECRAAASRLAELRAPIVAIGLGETYNELLLRELSNLTLGRPINADDPTMLPAIFERELGDLMRLTLRDVELNLRLVDGAQLVSLTRVYPSIADLDITRDSIDLGQVESGDYTIFVAELDAPLRPALLVRLAQLEVQYCLVPTGEMRRSGSKDLLVTYTADEIQAAPLDDEVLGYVQQRNVDRMISQATVLLRKQPQEAARYLDQARAMTQRCGNTGMTIAIDRAREDLDTRGAIAPATLKTISLGARTRTIRIGDEAAAENIPTNDEIRRLTGA